MAILIRSSSRPLGLSCAHDRLRAHPSTYIQQTLPNQIQLQFQTHKMKNPTSKFHRHLLLLFLLLIAAGKFQFHIFADAAQRKIHIPDELDDVVDEEEDDGWREWGKAKKHPDFDPPPSDFAKMGLHGGQITGPVFGFVKLRPGTPRTPVISFRCAILLCSALLFFLD